MLQFFFFGLSRTYRIEKKEIRKQKNERIKICKKRSFEEKFILSYWVDIFVVVVSLSYFLSVPFFSGRKRSTYSRLNSKEFYLCPSHRGIQWVRACVRMTVCLSVRMSMYMCKRFNVAYHSSARVENINFDCL